MAEGDLDGRGPGEWARLGQTARRHNEGFWIKGRCVREKKRCTREQEEEVEDDDEERTRTTRRRKKRRLRDRVGVK